MILLNKPNLFNLLVTCRMRIYRNETLKKPLKVEVFLCLYWCTWEESTATPFGRSRGLGDAFIFPIRSAAEPVRLYFVQKIKKSMIFHAFNFLLGAPGRSRTPGTCLRRALLYPSELQVQGLLLYEFYTSESLLSTC